MDEPLHTAILYHTDCSLYYIIHYGSCRCSTGHDSAFDGHFGNAMNTLLAVRLEHNDAYNEAKAPAQNLPTFCYY